MKTIEGYKIVNFSEYELHTASYDKSVKSYDIKEKGIAGRVVNPNLDDRFSVSEFCIWNEKGDCIYISTFGGNDWGLRDYYKINLADNTKLNNKL